MFQQEIENRQMIKTNVQNIIQRINVAQNQLSMVRLVAVSKTKTCQEIMQAYQVGIRNFGENYADQIREKQPKLPQDIKWHFIGHLQSNKISKILVKNLEYLETLDRQSLALKLNKQLLKMNRTLKVLIQVKISEEETKNGIAISEVDKLYNFVAKQCSQLQFKGLMTIGAVSDISCFEQMLKLKKIMCDQYHIEDKNFELSMGMSNDFQKAITFGATSVRIGSSIFGARIPKKL